MRGHVYAYERMLPSRRNPAYMAALREWHEEQPCTAEELELIFENPPWGVPLKQLALYAVLELQHLPEGSALAPHEQRLMEWYCRRPAPPGAANPAVPELDARGSLPLALSKEVDADCREMTYADEAPFLFGPNRAPARRF